MKSYHFTKYPSRLILLFLWLSSPLFAQAEVSAITNQQKQANESSLSTIENEVVLIDKDLPEQNVLLASLKPGIRIEYFESGDDMFSSINNALRNNAPVKALHIVTHGASGMIFTTSDRIDSEALESNTTEVRSWEKYFLPDAEILLYGCETSKGEDGIKFIKTLSELSTAKVAASNNPTGSISVGGDWILEQHTAVIKNVICFTENIYRYSFKLAKVYVHTGATLTSYGTSAHNYFNSLAGHSSTLGVDNVTTIPDLSTYSMVFINNPDRAINATEINNLKALINRGGRVIFVGEHSGFSDQNTNVTNAVIALGGHLSIQSLMLDGSTTYLPNTNFNTSSPMMEGVNKLWGSAASAVNIGGDATVLNISVTDPTKIVMAQERLGNGDIVAWADVNFWDKITDDTWGTGRFFKNALENSAANIISNTIATLTTTEAYSIGSSSAWSGGNISSDNGSNITQRGICWSTTTASPTTSDSKVIDASSGTGSFALKITGLSLNTKYYVRAFATNGLGTAYGNTISFTTPSIVNTAPTAVADVFSCPRNGTITGNVMSNDFDDDGDPMTATKVVNASYNSGTFTFNSNGTFTYTNNGNAAVSDFFTYYLSDGKSTSSTVGVSISIYTPTTPPTGGNGTITTLADGTYSFKAADFTYSSSSGSPFNGITVVTLPAKGVLKYNGLALAAGATCNDITKIVFDKAGDTGSNPFASFTFKVLDMTGQPSTSSYTMTVNLGLQNQTISFDAIPVKTLLDADFNPGATASSGLTVSYASSNTAVATIVGGMIHIVGIGSSTITASQAGDPTYNAATPVQQALAIINAPPVLTCSGGNNQLIRNAAPIIVDPTLTVSGSQNITGARVSIGSFQTGDVLAWNAGSLPSGVTGSFNTTIGVLTFSGTAAAAQWQTLLRTVTIATTSIVTTQRITTFTLGSSLPLDVNGHYYEFINSPGITWTNANTAANSKDLFGLQGYLATITGTAENDFISSKLDGNGWIGASDAAVEGAWRWVTGPEGLEAGGAGRNFYTGVNPTGAAVGSNYVHWYAGEPNNSGNEDYAHFYASGVQKGFWNDFAENNSSIAGYCVEYGGMAGDPTLQISSTKTLDVKLDQTITFAAPATKSYGDADFASGATASSGLTVTLVSSDPTVATVSGLNIHIVKAGNCTITASQAGDGTYIAATDVVQALIVNKASQTITFGPLSDKAFGDADFVPGATASSGLTVTYSSSNTAVASIVSNQIHIVGTGSCTIYADQAGDAEYNAATQVPQTLKVKVTPTVSAWPTASGITYGQALSSATLSGGTASVAGSFAYNDNTIKLNAGTYSADLTFTPTDGSNYAKVVGSIDIIVTKAMLTITADSKSKVYGESNPSLTLSYSGFVNSETSAALTSAPTVASTAVTSTTAVGTYTGDLVASGGVSSNYTFSYVAGNFEVTKAVLTATADNQTKVYGEANPTLTFQYSGWVNGVEAIDASPSITTIVDGTTVVGSYSNAITLSGGSDNNYTLSLVSGTFEVTKAVLTATADNQSKVYGEAIPTLTFQYSGWLNGDDADDLTTKPSASTTVSVTSPAAVYSGGITVAGGVDENYNFSYNSADFSVTKAALTVTANNKSKIYGASEPVLDYTVTGTLFNGDAPSVVTGITLNTVMGASATFGTHIITATGGSSDNYDVNHVNGTLTVSKAAALTVTANDKTKVYGEIEPVLDYISSGALYYSDTYSVISGVSLSTATGASATFGFHIITSSGGSAYNYDVNTVNGTLSVSKAPLEAIADNKSKLYGAANPVLSITYDEFKYTDNADSLAIQPLASTATSVTSNSGIYPIVLSEGSDNNYIISNTEGTLTIEKALLSVTADDKSKIYGQVNPELTASYTGFVNEDNINNLDVKPILSCAAGLTSDAGSYTITANGASDNNYTFEYNAGSLEILKADQVLTMEAIPIGLRTTQSHELEATSTSGLPVRFESSENSIADIVGNNMVVLKEGTVIITAIQEGNHNWNPAVSITQTVMTLPTFDNIRSLFTPNNDGMNDYWYISDIEQYGTISVQIYNRFGKLLYKSSAYNNDWDGTYNGTPLPEAAYYYIIKSSEKGLIKGVVNIVR